MAGLVIFVPGHFFWFEIKPIFTPFSLLTLSAAATLVSSVSCFSHRGQPPSILYFYKILACNSFISSLSNRRRRLLTINQEKYEPVIVKWTTERCAVCRWVEDWDYNKINICNRCQIAVHQECYGARNVLDFTSWVCKAYKTPEIKRTLYSRFSDTSNPIDRFEKIMRATQGALIVASTLQMILGFSGLWRNVVRFLSPISAVPLVGLVGFGLYEFGFSGVAKCIEIVLPELLILVFVSQYLPQLANVTPQSVEGFFEEH